MVKVRRSNGGNGGDKVGDPGMPGGESPLPVAVNSPWPRQW